VFRAAWGNFFAARFLRFAQFKPGTGVKVIVKCRLIFLLHDLSSGLLSQSNFFISSLALASAGEFPVDDIEGLSRIVNWFIHEQNNDEGGRLFDIEDTSYTILGFNELLNRLDEAKTNQNQ
jgi:hypothetical protein